MFDPHKAGEIAVSVQNLGLIYKTTIDKKLSLSNRVKHLGRGTKQTRIVNALDGVNLDIDYGNVLGVDTQNNRSNNDPYAPVDVVLYLGYILLHPVNLAVYAFVFHCVPRFLLHDVLLSGEVMRIIVDLGFKSLEPLHHSFL